MSFVDLATLTMHRQNELGSRLYIFWDKCDRAVENIKRMKTKTQGFVRELNCDPSELKDRFLTVMKQLDEYMYLITDFNLAMSAFDEGTYLEYTPVQDTYSIPLTPLPPSVPLNLIDVLSEPAPSTSTACQNNCPPEKPKRVKTRKPEQTLIVFSSTSSSEETVPQAQSEVVGQAVQCELEAGLNNVRIEDVPVTCEAGNLPAQLMLETETTYMAALMHIDGAFFWVITENYDEAHDLMVAMTQFYTENHVIITKEEVKSLTCCAFYDDDSECYYRGLFLKLNEEDSEVAEIFAVDTGEIRCVPLEWVQQLCPRFCTKPPYARCCHLAGVDLASYRNKNLMKKQEEFMWKYVGKQYEILVDDNTSESLGVYVILPSGDTLNDVMVQEGLALPTDKPLEEKKHSSEPDHSPEPHHSPEPDHCPEPDHSPEPDPSPEPDSSSNQADFGITDCPEYEDPVEAVTGYKNRDEIDICKHYKGGPMKTCFKGSRCTKKHVLMHPDGWTLDRVPVMGKCKSLPLPAPDTWHRVQVTFVCHYDRVYVQLLSENVQEPEIPSFGVVLPPTTLAALVRDMNSRAAQVACKPLTITPAPGELVAALYPPDNHWYRARVLSLTRADQTVEVLYVDYGTVLWVKEDQLRSLEPRQVALPMQATRCVLAGVRARSHQSQQWAQAKKVLSDLVQNKTLDMHVIARDYDEISVELFNEEGHSIAELLAVANMVELTEYQVVDDSAVTKKIVVP